MTSLISSETISGLTPLLGSIARLVNRSGHVSMEQVSILLESTEVEPTQEVLAELERWSRLLEKALGSTDEGIQQAVEEALTQRGLPQATVLLAVATVATSQTESRPRAETKMWASELSVSVERLDFGIVEEGQSATLSFTIQGGPGKIVADSEQITVDPQQFQSEMTMLTVTVNPVHKQGTLWSTIRFITASEAVEIPVVAQWHEVNDKHDDSVPHSDPTSTTVVTGGASARVRLVAGGLLVLAIVWAVISWYPKDEDAVAIITPSPTLAQTKLPSPTTSPTAKHTQTPTPDLNHFVVSGPPGHWMPAEAIWLSDLRLEVDQEFTNEEIAKNYADPDVALARFEEMQRISTHSRVYSARDYCNLDSGITDVWIRIIVFREPEGVTFFIDTLDGTDFAVGEPYEVVGEQSWIRPGGLESDCSPPQRLEFAELNFRRFNIYGSVAAASIWSNSAYRDLEYGVIQLAKAIDDKLLEAVP